MSERRSIADLIREYNALRRETAVAARLTVAAPPGSVVDHIDGNRWNTDPDNLRIIDPRENVRREDKP